MHVNGRRGRRSAPDHRAEARPAKQARSQETLSSLLDATEALLREDGLEAATVPAIAARAGLSVGVVYRRFADKDALLRAVYERLFERFESAMAHGLQAEYWEGISIADMVRTFVGSLVSQHRRNRELLRALTAYTQSGADPEFRRRVDALNAATTQRVAELFLERRAQIDHPNPEEAAAFGLFAITATLQSIVQSGATTRRSFGASEADLVDELTRMYLRYLGVTVLPSPRPGDPRPAHRR